MTTRKIFGIVLLAVLLSVCILYGDGPAREADEEAGATVAAPAGR